MEINNADSPSMTFKIMEFATFSLVIRIQSDQNEKIIEFVCTDKNEKTSGEFISSFTIEQFQSEVIRKIPIKHPQEEKPLNDFIDNFCQEEKILDSLNLLFKMKKPRLEIKENQNNIGVFSFDLPDIEKPAQFEVKKKFINNPLTIGYNINKTIFNLRKKFLESVEKINKENDDLKEEYKKLYDELEELQKIKENLSNDINEYIDQINTMQEKAEFVLTDKKFDRIEKNNP